MAGGAEAKVVAVADGDKGYFRQFCEYMKRDTKGVEIAAYTLSGVLFVIAYKKIRPITRFGKPSDIPRHFIREQLPQYGRVQKIEPSIQSGPLLLIKHRPPLNLTPWSSKTLPVKVAGVEINANGYSWLQSVVTDRSITFIPVKETDASGTDYAECRVYFYDRSSDGKSSRKVDVGHALVSLGFAKLNVTVVPKEKIPKHDVLKRQTQHYLQTLAKTESIAKDRRVGVWQQSLPPKIWPALVWQSAVDSLVRRVTPASHQLPELVR
ncbi:uncharacterized protein LOC129760000 [Uranotaenia lowii]|uniref:uncharacterized protein LOC129760000 n=1 Tax=Uranotaenia lowii TaxID=190385 RepID=UPI0024793187|nr:uncharacterized protein LOC129760000 [Uranotaenia lowii]